MRFRRLYRPRVFTRGNARIHDIFFCVISVTGHDMQIRLDQDLGFEKMLREKNCCMLLVYVIV